ncbi:outer membrane lipoprotein chaperone LolA [Vogesella indigofera]|uniref:outer membrane lipoprotein chaperone LolA n=1 Tax=Vogesella indigofera TaxID=45465 RepID=UPI00234CACA4|nr:outer membrane lipoprotein chaperone LolA [Vogesella indigofera]MDC7704448.1 outer membrane lipoprotein chaperone LolA [Vogesella indigofera]
MKQALLGLLLAATLPVHAAALPQFKAFIAGTKTLAADFTQTVSGKQRQETAHGTMQIQRPGKLRWTYAQPFEQLIVGDGKTLWLYDKELAQVTRRDQAGALGNSPAALLAGSNAIERDYQLREVGKTGKVEWLAASPKKADNTFESIKMGFTANQLVEMELADSFGNITRIQFKNLQRNAKVNPAQFRFAPPAGVDVVGE